MPRKQINSGNKIFPKTIINAYMKLGKESIHWGKKGREAEKGHLEEKIELLEIQKEIKAVLIYF